MKKHITLLPAFLSLFVFGNAQAQFSSGNLVILQVGNGTGTLGSSAAPLFLKEFDKTTGSQTSPISSVAIPPSGNAARLTTSGSATSEAQLTRSSDSTLLVLAGYDADSGTISIGSTTAAAVARVIDTVGYRAIPGRADSTHSAFSGNSIRSATRNGNDDYWTAGGATGTYYMGNTTTPGIIQSATATNTRVILAANGKLYFTTSSGTPRLLRINAQPTSASIADTLILFPGGSSPYGFAINSAENTVYVADDRSAASGGGIQKWTLSGTTWSLAYTLNAGTGIGARSVIADWSTASPTLFAVTTATGGSLVRIIDSNASATPFVLTTGSTNAVIRSVAFTPEDPCSRLAATVSVTGLTTRCMGDSVLLAANTGVGYSYQWSNGTKSYPQDTFSTFKAGVSGNYKVRITSSKSCSVVSVPIAITINPLPSVTVTASGSTTVCTGNTLQLCVSSASGLTYQWRKNFVNIATAIYPCDTVNASGTYKVIVTNTATGCFDSSKATTVTVGPPPSAAISPSGIVPFCIGSSVTLHTNSSPGLTYTWLRNDTTLTGAGTMDSTIVAAIPGRYKVKVSASVGCADSAVDTVVIVALPDTRITKLTPDSVCGGDTVRVRAAGGLYNVYEWEIVGLGTTPPQADSNYYQATPDNLGVTTIVAYKLIVTNVFGCKDSSALQTVTIVPPPTPFITSSGGVLSVGLYSSYQWYLNGAIIAGATTRMYMPTLNGVYYAIVTNAPDCDGISDSVTITGLKVSDLLTQSGVFVFPNPAKDLITIKAPFTVTVRLMDLQGRLLLRKTETNNLDIHSLPDGSFNLSVYRIDGSLIGTRIITKSGN